MRALLWILTASMQIQAWATDAAPTLTDPEAAAIEALRGRPDRAKSMLATANGAPLDAKSLVVLASIALDQGNLREASGFVSRLRSLRPDVTEGKVLEALVEERSAHPRADWLSAGFAALKQLQPLALSDSLVPFWDRVAKLPFPEEPSRKLNATDAFLARWAWTRGPNSRPDATLVKQAAGLAGSSERPLVLVAALLTLDSAAEGATPGEEAAVARRSLIAKLESVVPTRLWYLDVLQHSKAAPIADEDVVAIERAVGTGPSPFFAAEYTDLLHVLQKLDPAAAPGIAMGQAVD